MQYMKSRNLLNIVLTKLVDIIISVNGLGGIIITLFPKVGPTRSNLN